MMPPIRIIPQYRLLMRYNIRLEMYEPYYQYVTNEFVPALHNMGCTCSEFGIQPTVNIHCARSNL